MLSVEIDLILIKALLSKVIFDKYFSLIDLNTLSEEAKIILHALDVYFKNKPDEIQLTLTKFSPWFIALHNNWSSDQQEYYKNIFSRILEIPAEDIEMVISDLQKRTLWKIINDIKDNNFDTQKIEDLVHKFNTEKLSTTAVKYLEYNSWVNDEADKGVYRWHLHAMQKAWGNLRAKNFYLITATTHTGKSSFMTSEAVSVCNQLKANQTILYFNNERSEGAVLERFLSGYFNCDVDTIRANKQKAIERFLEKHPSMPVRIFSARDGRKTMREIESACSLYKPALVIIDVVDKLITGGNTESRRPYEVVFAWARDVAIKYNTIVMGATQYKIASDRNGQELPTQKMTQHGAFDAKVDKAANTDFMLGIQNVPMYPTQKKIYLLRAKEGEEDINFYCKFDQVTGIFDNFTSGEIK